MKAHATALVVIAVASFVGGAQAAGISGQGDWETTLAGMGGVAGVAWRCRARR